MRDPVRATLSTLALLIHLAVANRYDFFRDELYFIICGRHPAFGYADQPPGIPLLSAFTQLFGEHLFLLRSITAIAAAATVYVVVSLARLLGARTLGAVIAGTAAAIAPMYLGLMTVVNTTSFEPLCWTLLAYLCVRAVRDDEPAMWLWAGLVIGLDLEVKYELPIYLLPLIASLIVTGHLRKLLCWQVAAAAGIATLLAAPSLIWQLKHGLPFLEMIHNQAKEGKNVSLPPLAFIGQQILVMNPLFAPIWLAGVAAPFFSKPLRPARYLSLAFLITFAIFVILHAKDYYLAPLYGTMFAIGAVALEQWLASALLVPYLALAAAMSCLIAPLALPILPPATLVWYLDKTHLQPKPAETLKQSPIPQTFADMFGWREMTAKMTEAVAKLSPEQRAHTVILAHNYGEAAAFEFYGQGSGLPPVVSGHNSYFIWGLKGSHADSFLAFNREPKELMDKCAEAREVTHFFASPDAKWMMPFEDDSAITLCRDAKPSLEALWPSFKLYF